jgi:hypothetical protein
MTRKSILFVLLTLIITGATLSACAPASTPADVIEKYLEALAEKDQTSAVANSCAAWEEKALAEGASFINVEVVLEDLECQVRDQTDTEASVACSGKFISSYTAGEDQELDLGGLVFSLALEGGEWRMCGYQY